MPISKHDKIRISRALSDTQSALQSLQELNDLGPQTHELAQQIITELQSSEAKLKTLKKWVDEVY